MRLTGIVVALAGVMILAFTALMEMQPNRTTSGTTAVSDPQRDRTWPMVIGAGALIGGGLLATLGGRGYFVSRDLAVRN